MDYEAKAREIFAEYIRSKSLNVLDDAIAAALKAAAEEETERCAGIAKKRGDEEREAQEEARREGDTERQCNRAGGAASARIIELQIRSRT